MPVSKIAYREDLLRNAIGGDWPYSREPNFFDSCLIRILTDAQLGDDTVARLENARYYMEKALRQAQDNAVAEYKAKLLNNIGSFINRI